MHHCNLNYTSLFLFLNISLQRTDGSTQEALQDVDDWDLTELNPDWDVGGSRDNVSSVVDSGDDAPSPLPSLVCIRIFSLCILAP